MKKFGILFVLIAMMAVTTVAWGAAVTIKIGEVKFLAVSDGAAGVSSWDVAPPDSQVIKGVVSGDDAESCDIIGMKPGGVVIKVLSGDEQEDVASWDITVSGVTLNCAPLVNARIDDIVTVSVATFSNDVKSTDVSFDIGTGNTASLDIQLNTRTASAGAVSVDVKIIEYGSAKMRVFYSGDVVESADFTIEASSALVASYDKTIPEKSILVGDTISFDVKWKKAGTTGAYTNVTVTAPSNVGSGDIAGLSFKDNVVTVTGIKSGDASIKLKAIDKADAGNTKEETIKFKIVSELPKTLDGTFTPSSMLFSSDAYKTTTVAWTYGTTPNPSVTQTFKLTGDANVVSVDKTGDNTYKVTPMTPKKNGTVNLVVTGKLASDGTISKDITLPIEVSFTEAPEEPEVLNGDEKARVDEAIADFAGNPNYPTKSFDIVFAAPIKAHVEVAGGTKPIGPITVSTEFLRLLASGGTNVLKVLDGGAAGELFSKSSATTPSGMVNGEWMLYGDKFYVAIKDDGNYDLDKVNAKVILDPIAAIWRKPDPEDPDNPGGGGGGCNASYIPFAVLLAAPLFFLKKKD